MLSNAYFLAKFRFDTAKNEPAKNLQKFKICKIICQICQICLGTTGREPAAAEAGPPRGLLPGRPGRPGRRLRARRRGARGQAGPTMRDKNINGIPYPYSGSFSAVSKPKCESK